MHKLMLSALVAATSLMAVPASAQPYGYRGREIARDINQLIERIHRAEDRDAISKREEDRLLRQARRIERLHYRYSRNGLSRWEAQDLRARIQDLRRQLRFERWDDRGPGSRW